MTSGRGAIRIGHAGFSYPDWAGIVHPRGRAIGGRGAHPLARLASYVDLLEVNVSHYRIPAPETARRWLEETASRPAFRFTAKLWKGFTHGPEHPTPADLAAMRAFLAALGADGRLLAALAQFPATFRANTRTEAYVHRLADHVEGVPLAVEFRDASWDRDDVRDAFRAKGIAWVVGDLLPLPRGVPPRPLATAPLAYLRLHGRNPAWAERGAERDRRYDWLYEPADLERFAGWVRGLRAEANEVLVVANNHFEGKGLANALELRALLDGAKVDVPAGLLTTVPRLRLVANEPTPEDGILRGFA